MLILIFSYCQPVSRHKSTPEITAAEIKTHIAYLASDYLEGRLVGSPGCRKAADYIAREFRKYRLLPFSGEKDFFQTFPFPGKIVIDDGCRLTINQSMVPASDYCVLSYSAADSIAAAVVFVGYGLCAEEIGHNDYRTIDISGKIALILEDKSAEQERFTPYLNTYQKALVAREKGACAVLFTDGDSCSVALGVKASDEQFHSGDLGIPAIRISRRLTDQILHFADQDIDRLQQQLQVNHSGPALQVPSVTLSVVTRLHRETAYCRNVIGWLPSSDPTCTESVIIGAHYDHLGWQHPSSLSRDTIAVHNGADDNASGVAALLELAQYFAARRDSLRRRLIFIAFSGEEAGLIGSTYYTRNPLGELPQTVAMLNMDMIGRLRDNSLLILGTGTADNWETLLNEANHSIELSLNFQSAGFAASDHSSFYRQRIPVLFFFTGLHSDYHKYSDDVEKINFNGIVGVAFLLQHTTRALTISGITPSFQSVDLPQPGMERSVGRGTWLGTIPDFGTTVEYGVPLAGVTENGPAARSGLQSGDIIVRLGHIKVRNLQDLTFAIGQHAPSETVEIEFIRNQKPRIVAVTLGYRSSRR